MKKLCKIAACFAALSFVFCATLRAESNFTEIRDKVSYVSSQTATNIRPNTEHILKTIQTVREYRDDFTFIGIFEFSVDFLPWAASLLTVALRIEAKWMHLLINLDVPLNELERMADDLVPDIDLWHQLWGTFQDEQNRLASLLENAPRAW